MIDRDLSRKLDKIALEKALVNKGFRNFIPLAWHIICPSVPFTYGWHIDAIADHLEACFTRDIRNLVINVPPGSSKSLTACVAFPAWCWSQNPGEPSYGTKERFIYGTYDEKLARRDSIACRNLIEDPWYKDRWGDTVEFDKTQEFTGDIYYNNQGGSRKIATVGGSVVGFHASMHFTDDPLKPMDVKGTMHQSKSALESASSWWNETMSVRTVDYNRLSRVIIMQRLHHADIAGEMLDTGDYTHLMLPMEFEPKRKCFIEVTGFEDPRTQVDELLCEARWDRTAVDISKRDLGPRAAQAQLQQNPTPLEGALFRSDRVQFYTEVPKPMRRQTQSWDLSLKETTDGSYVVGQVWGVFNRDYYLLDQVRRRMGLMETCRELERLSRKWPKSIKKLIESKANGPAVYDAMHKRINGITLVEPRGGKMLRAQAVEPLWEACNVWLPHPTIAPWINDEFIAEFCGFPSMPNDDVVDAASQCLTYLHHKSFSRLKAAMNNVFKTR